MPKKSTLIGAVAASLMATLFIALVMVDYQHPLAEIITEQFTPARMLGVPRDHMQLAAQAYSAFPRAFMADQNAPDHSRDNVRLWEIVRKVKLDGKPVGNDIGCGPQQTGDCVSWGLAHCITVRLSIQNYKNQSSGGDGVYQPYLYGVARVNAKKAHFPCDSPGAYPSVAAQSLADFGYLVLVDNPPPYSGSIADQWGCRGVPENFLKIGKTRAGGAVYPIRSTDELRDAICNGYPCTIAVTFKPGQKYVADGRGCIQWNGRVQGGHQMCVTAYDGSLGQNHEYFFIQNSHGPHAQAACDPMQNEPLGGFWIPLSLARDWLSNGESWAVSDVAGFPVEDGIDWSVFDRFRVQVKGKPNDQSQNRRKTGDARSVVLAQ